MNEIPQFVVPKNITVGQVLQKVGKATVSALVVLTGKDIKSVRNALKSLYSNNTIHIGSYETNKRGKISQVWHWGDGDDAREPVVSKQTFIPRPDEAAAWLRNPI
jgi:transcription initiation factor IIE alpha subunit